MSLFKIDHIVYAAKDLKKAIDLFSQFGYAFDEEK